MGVKDECLASFVTGLIYNKLLFYFTEVAGPFNHCMSKMLLSIIPVCVFFFLSLRKLVDDIVELLDELKFEAEDILLLPDT